MRGVDDESRGDCCCGAFSEYGAAAWKNAFSMRGVAEKCGEDCESCADCGFLRDVRMLHVLRMMRMPGDARNARGGRKRRNGGHPPRRGCVLAVNGRGFDRMGVGEQRHDRSRERLKVRNPRQ